jgi:hypothetical protein
MASCLQSEQLFPLRVLQQEADAQLCTPAGAAASFLKARMFEGRKRSFDMLQSSKGLCAPAKKFA